MLKLIKEHVTYVKTQLDRDVKAIRMDNEPSLRSREFSEFCKERGIRILATTPYHSEMNGRAEVTNKLVTEKARKMMIAGNVDKLLWPEVVKSAAMLLNLTPSTALGVFHHIQLSRKHDT